MLSQDTADKLLKLEKKLLYKGVLSFPSKGEKISIDAISLDEKEKFIFNINRGKIDIKKCTYHSRTSKNDSIARLDIVSNNSFHYNPDGEKIVGPHLHYYIEGFELSWAKPINLKEISYTGNLCDCLVWFFKYCNVVNIPYIKGRFDDDVIP